MAQGLFNLKQQLQGLIQKAWTGTQKTNFVEYLVVAGGGSGSYSASTQTASGGGAGGLLTGMVPVTAGASYTVTVGGGGAAQTGGGSAGNNGVASVFGSITATGGGGGGASGYQGNAGGSGGGGYRPLNGGGFGLGIFGQGNNGGLAGDNNGAGGGGAGTVGTNVVGGANGSVGGSGIASAISGTVAVYAGGGSGGSSNSGTYYAPGSVGGGGNGGSYASTTAGNGTVNTGGGGGGGPSMTSGAGGSGIVIISYPDIYNAPTTLTGTYTASTRGNGSLYFNGSSWIDYGATTSNYASGDFTIESWVNYSSFTAGYSLWFTMDPNTTYFGPTSSTRIVLNLGNSTELAWTYTAQTLGVWYHMAVVRSGTTVTLYINGVSQGTNTSSATLGSGGGNIRVGSAVGYPFNGYLSNLRYTKSAVYTSNFTPSLYPLTPLTNTRLLTAVTSVGTYTDETGNSTSQTVTGTPTFNASMPFASGIGLQNRVYTWTASGTVTF